MRLRFLIGWGLLSLIGFSCYATWPQFRGPTGDGHSDATGLPLTWSEEKNVKWKTPIPGRGWSSPVIESNEVWMTTANEAGSELSVVCVDIETGKIKHNRKLFDVANPQPAIDFNSYASPTPVIQDGRLYASWGSPAIACIDTTTAKVIWERRDFVCNHYRGPGSSPVLYKNLLIYPFDGSDFQYVVALDKNTGKTVWRTERSVDFNDLVNGKPDRDGDWRKAFSTPRVFEFAGEPFVFSQGAKAFYAYEPATGKELWRVEEPRTHSTSTTPIFGSGVIYLCSGNPKGEVWAVRPGGKGVVTDTHIIWRASHNVPTRPSLLWVNDLVFMVDDGGFASCLDAKTGNEIWRERIGGSYSASPLYSEGHIYFFSEDGKTFVINAARQFKVIAESKVGDGFMASAATEGKALYLRSKTQLYRVENAGTSQ